MLTQAFANRRLQKIFRAGGMEEGWGFPSMPFNIASLLSPCGGGHAGSRGDELEFQTHEHLGVCRRAGAEIVRQGDWQPAIDHRRDRVGA